MSAWLPVVRPRKSDWSIMCDLPRRGAASTASGCHVRASCDWNAVRLVAGTWCGVVGDLSAADWALTQVEAVRENPAQRLALLEWTHPCPTGQAPHHLPFRRAAMAFMRWQLARGVLATPDGQPVVASGQ